MNFFSKTKWTVECYGQMTGNRYEYKFVWFMRAWLKARYIKRHELVDYNNVKIYMIL